MACSNYQLESFTVTQRRIKVSDTIFYHTYPIKHKWHWTGIQTTQDAHFYARSAKFDEVFNNEGKSFVVQFSVKHEQKIDCGGGYVKVSTCDPVDALKAY